MLYGEHGEARGPSQKADKGDRNHSAPVRHDHSSVISKVIQTLEEASYPWSLLQAEQFTCFVNTRHSIPNPKSPLGLEASHFAPLNSILHTASRRILCKR